MRTTVGRRTFGRGAAVASALVIAILPSLALAGHPAQNGDSPGLLGPIVVLLVIVLLNIFLLAFAFRLRRYFRDLAERNDEE